MSGVKFLWFIAVFIILGIMGYMIYIDREGWGWLLFVSLLLIGGISWGSDEKYTENDLRKAFDTDNTKITWNDFLESIMPEEEEDDN